MKDTCILSVRFYSKKGQVGKRIILDNTGKWITKVLH